MTYKYYDQYNQNTNKSSIFTIVTHHVIIIMIKSFKDKETEKVFRRKFSRKLPPEIQKKAYRQLTLISFAQKLSDLTFPKSNHLKEMKGNMGGNHSIRINKQWRICFIWIGEDAYKVGIIDYH